MHAMFGLKSPASPPQSYASQRLACGRLASRSSTSPNLEQLRKLTVKPGKAEIALVDARPDLDMRSRFRTRNSTDATSSSHRTNSIISTISICIPSSSTVRSESHPDSITSLRLHSILEAQTKLTIALPSLLSCLTVAAPHVDFSLHRHVAIPNLHGHKLLDTI
ncbi:hypothetical protein BCV70DRAFT_201645 [Testicularia cyperi]|uniref:Uncharacterized protein n=1 Tax=Testicularia cyperi TaxID=1882483 RepID=A0A317XLV8_9BASI|nr:hypothetical protein BCV70DRAFT_201645 [Testicularia cyperi]